MCMRRVNGSYLRPVIMRDGVDGWFEVGLDELVEVVDECVESE